MRPHLPLAVRLFLALLVASSICPLSAPSAAAAPAGSLDATFGAGGSATVPYGTGAAAAATVVQPDGDIVTAGQAWLAGGASVMLFTRMTANGRLDPTFGAGGVVAVPIGGAAGIDSGAALALQPNGKIVAAGSGLWDGRLVFAAVRLNADGSLDHSFGAGGVVTVPIGDYAIANAVAIQPNGDIVLGGGTAQGSGIYFAAARLTPNGALDPTFGAGGVTVATGQPMGDAWGMVLERDGGIVLAGEQASCPSCAEGYEAVRLRPDGQIDTTFGAGGVFTLRPGANAAGLAAGLQPNGDIVISGQAEQSGGWRVVTVAVTPTGALDPAFGSGGIAQFPGAGVNALAIDASGRIDLAGVGVAVVRLNPNGSLDTTFGSGGLAGFYCDSQSCAANGIALAPADGAIVLAGASASGGSDEILTLRVNP